MPASPASPPDPPAPSPSVFHRQALPAAAAARAARIAGVRSGRDLNLRLDSGPIPSPLLPPRDGSSSDRGAPSAVGRRLGAVGSWGADGCMLEDSIEELEARGGRSCGATHTMT